MVHYKRIFIIGQPGAGKDLLAKTLAEKLGWKFINANLDLETRVGRMVDEIMGATGLKGFLDCQAEILSSQLNKENIVVTTDASIVCNERCAQLLTNELVVFLQVSLPVQLERSSPNQPPLLKTELRDFFEKLHVQRDALYKDMANILIDSSDNALEKHVMTIMKLVLQNQDTEQTAAKTPLDKKELAFFHKQTHQLVYLTEQQARCLKLLAQGKTSKEIARHLCLSYRTVEGNVAKTMEILGCSSSKELIVLYHEKP